MSKLDYYIVRHKNSITFSKLHIELEYFIKTKTIEVYIHDYSLGGIKLSDLKLIMEWIENENL